MLKIHLGLAATAALVLFEVATPAAQLPRNPGVSSVCGTFTIDINLVIGSISIAEFNCVSRIAARAWIAGGRRRDLPVV